MSTITREFTKEQLISAANARMEFAEMMMTKDLLPLQIRNWAIEAELARIALASLEAEPVADIVAWSHPTEERTCDIRWRRFDVAPGSLYTAPPAPLVPDEMAISDDMNLFQKSFAQGHNACLAAMLQGKE